MERPWKVMMNGCCIKDYKSKRAAIKYAKMKINHTPKDSDIWVVSPFELIEFNDDEKEDCKAEEHL